MLRDVQEKVRDGQGKVEFLHLFTKEELGSKTRLCAKTTLPPGSSIGLHPHHEEEEVYYILRGKARVNDNGTVRDLGPGDAVLTGGGSSHSIENIGDEPLEVLAIIIPF
jgi:mannose-6-phosphate isomerase-like protein (cupin superfamily)